MTFCLCNPTCYYCRSCIFERIGDCLVFDSKGSSVVIVCFCTFYLHSHQHREYKSLILDHHAIPIPIHIPIPHNTRGQDRSTTVDAQIAYLTSYLLQRSVGPL